jgi:Ca2+/Na+ antiporter
MNVAALALIVGVVAITYVVVQWRRDQVEKSYEKGKRYREIVTISAAVLIAWLFIRSGDPLRMAVALLLFATATIFILVEQPHKDIV